MKFSIIIPVYNRPNEIEDLLDSLLIQKCKDFEVLIIEDGSSIPCEKVVEAYNMEEFNLRYFQKENTGRSLTRNYGMERAKGDFFLFFDSDCILPEHYIESLKKELEKTHVDCFGGPDQAHKTFSPLQKAISYTMTSFLTTGGIRGGKKSMERFVPRSFNMGFSRKVYEKVGGFKDMFGEDIDLSSRIIEAGFTVELFHDLYVYHKRRVNLSSFFRQVYVFGMARIDLFSIHPKSLKIVHLLPSFFIIGVFALLLAGCFINLYYLLPLLLYIVSLFFSSLVKNKDFKVASLSVISAFIQLGGYGLGFINAFVCKFILRQKLDVKEQLKKHYKQKA